LTGSHVTNVPCSRSRRRPAACCGTAGSRRCWREGERWNAGTAWEFPRAHSSWDEKRLRFELHRYLGWPGQVPSYKLGERVWLQAREEAKARAGGAFSLKDFRSKALSLGAMGLDPLREALSRC
jgi:uncharacterized protein (DUF885 family)